MIRFILSLFKFSFVSPKAKIHRSVKIGFFCFIQGGVEIGEKTVVKSYVELRRGSIIGRHCYIDSRVSMSGRS